MEECKNYFLPLSKLQFFFRFLSPKNNSKLEHNFHFLPRGRECMEHNVSIRIWVWTWAVLTESIRDLQYLLQIKGTEVSEAVHQWYEPAALKQEVLKISPSDCWKSKIISPRSPCQSHQPQESSNFYFDLHHLHQWCLRKSPSSYFGPHICSWTLKTTSGQSWPAFFFCSQIFFNRLLLAGLPCSLPEEGDLGGFDFSAMQGEMVKSQFLSEVSEPAVWLIWNQITKHKFFARNLRSLGKKDTVFPHSFLVLRGVLWLLFLV